MGSRQETVDYLTDQMSGAGEVSARKMFGEYGVYCDGKMAALICDDRLFLKPTAAGAALLPDAETAPPYPGAKPHIVVPEEMWEDADLMASLLARTAEALPAPKPKKRKTP
jgi:DNA transformation protein